MRYLIVNADDAGFSAVTDAALLEAVEKERLSSCSVAVNAAPAARLAEHLKRMTNPPDIGLHLNLTEGAPVSPRRDVPTLIGPDGGFLGLRRFLLGLAAGGVRRAEIRREIEAQFARAAELGLKLTHIDGHHHAHLLPGVAAHAAAAAARAGIAWFRPSSAPAALIRPIDPKTIQFTVFDIVAGATSSTYRKRGLRAPDVVFRIASGTESFEDCLFRVLSESKHTVAELLCHPGRRDSAFCLPENEIRKRELELEFIMNLDGKRLFEATGFTLARRRDIN